MLLAGNLPSLVAMQNAYCQRQGNVLKTNNNYWWGKIAQMFVFLHVLCEEIVQNWNIFFIWQCSSLSFRIHKTKAYTIKNSIKVSFCFLLFRTEQKYASHSREQRIFLAQLSRYFRLKNVLSVCSQEKSVITAERIHFCRYVYQWKQFLIKVGVFSLER